MSCASEAARHFRAALFAREGQEMDGEMAGLLVALGKAALNNGDTSEAWRTLRGAFEYFSAAGEHDRAVDVAYIIGTSTSLIRPSTVQLLQRALQFVEEGSEGYGKLQVAIGQCLAMMGAIVEAKEAFARAEVVAVVQH